ncbi:hypothetical protein MKC73_04895 [[Clostridium] innocuum]|nr:hypothetical protein [[Clostridium] innocuum]
MEFTTQQLEAAHKEIISIIRKCEKMEGKFAEGTSQHTLLKNRLLAMQIAKQLLEETLYSSEINTADDNGRTYSYQELAFAKEPVCSIIRKCSKAQRRYIKETANYRRYVPMIEAMQIAEQLIEEQQTLCTESSKS